MSTKCIGKCLIPDLFMTCTGHDSAVCGVITVSLLAVCLSCCDVSLQINVAHVPVSATVSDVQSSSSSTPTTASQQQPPASTSVSRSVILIISVSRIPLNSPGRKLQSCGLQFFSRFSCFAASLQFWPCPANCRNFCKLPQFFCCGVFRRIVFAAAIDICRMSPVCFKH